MNKEILELKSQDLLDSTWAERELWIKRHYVLHVEVSYMVMFIEKGGIIGKFIVGFDFKRLKSREMQVCRFGFRIKR